MQALEKRIDALEKIKPNQGLVIFIVGIEPGKLHEELTYISDGKGNEWIRRADESEEEFKDRVKREVVRNAGGVARVFSFKMPLEH